MDVNQSVSLSPTQSTLQSQSSIQIRAPLSLEDSDFESRDNTTKTLSRTSSINSFVSEEGEGFISGEDGFETASEAHEELGMELGDNNNKDLIGGEGLSMTPPPPKARISGDEEEEDEEVVEVVDGDGVPVVVRVPIVEKDEGLVVEEGEKLGDDSDFSGLSNGGLSLQNQELSPVEKVEESTFDGSKEDELAEIPKVESSENGVVESNIVDENSEVNPEVVGKELEDVEEKKIEEEVVDEDKKSESLSTGEGEVKAEEVDSTGNGESGAVQYVEENATSEVKSPETEVKDAVTPDVEAEPEKSEVVETGVISEQSPAVVDEADDSEVVASGLQLPAATDETDESKVVDTGAVSEQASAVVAEPQESKVVETDAVSEQLPVEADEVDESKAVEKDVVSEQASVVPHETDDLKSVEAPVVAEKSPPVVAQLDYLKAVKGDSNVAKPVEENDSAAEPVVGTLEPEKQESIEVSNVQKDDDEKDDSSVANSVSLDSNHVNEKPELDGEPETDSGSTLSEPVLGVAVAGDENADGEVQSTESLPKSAEVNIEQEDKVQVLSAKSSDAGADSESEELEVVDTSTALKTAARSSAFAPEVNEEAEDEIDHSYDEEGEGSVSDEGSEGLNFGSSATAEQIMKELMRGSGVSFSSGAQSSQVDGQIIMDSDEEVDTDEEGEGKELFDSAALAALLKAATSGGAEGGNVTISSQDGSRLFNIERPAGLGSSMRSSKPVSQPTRPNIFTSSELMAGGESEVTLSEEEKKKLEKLQLVRVKFLRLISRLGHSPDDAIAAQVLYRMVLAAGRQTGQAFSLENAKKTAMQLEAEESDDLDFSLNILVLGKTGVGKSATINSIYGEEKTKIGAFEVATTAVKEIIGTVGGVKIRVFDTPGLKSSVMEQAFNRKVLSSVKKLIKKHPLDILLYVDRLDTQTRDLNDLPMLRTITNTLGSTVWRSAVVTLTHAASAPPDGPSGSPLSYEVFVAQRSHIVQQSIGQAVGDLRMMNPSLMNPVSLVENHPSCRKNRDGQRILPNGQIWRPQLLLLCYSLKVLSEVSSLSKPQDPFDSRKLFGFRVRAPPLPYLLSSLLQSRAHPKLPDDQGGENVDSDIDLDDLEDSDQEEEEDEYDQLPPFKPLRKAQIAKLSKDQKKAYFDEYDYRVKLLQKKQWKEELKRMKEMKKKGNKDQTENPEFAGEDAEQDGPAAVPVPLPDMVLPPSFDGDNPAYRYRFLEPTSQLLARPVLDTHGWDHDCGYDGVSLEENLALAGRFPGGVAVQITKDKKEFNIHLDSSIAAKHGENGSTLAGFDIQTIGKQLGYIVRGETKFKNFKKNKTTGGISVTFLGENVATGLKIEDQITIGKRLTLVGSTGTIRSGGDVAYGANLEASLKEKDFPIGQDQSTLGLSLMKWRGDLALGANLQSQFAIGRSSKMNVRVGLNNKLSGQITVRTSSSDQLQLALVGILPIAISIYRSIWPSAGESFSAY
ncbi:hypothetical protein ACHQM5_026602 [Ranunculus cassubicifolius]